MLRGKKLKREDYADTKPTRVARFFLGKFLCVQAADGYAEGMITETEAYGGPEDAASHAFGNRRTARTEVMFASGGVAYVYFCYGMHRMFNIVTGPQDLPQAVLVRAVQITAGQEKVRKRRKGIAEKDWASGPGRVCARIAESTRRHSTRRSGRGRIKSSSPPRHPPPRFSGTLRCRSGSATTSPSRSPRPPPS